MTLRQELELGRSCLLVTGAPGAGKSTVSSLIAQTLPRSALLGGDLIKRLVVSGRSLALADPTEEAVQQVQLCITNLCDLAINFVDAGFTPVLDWVVPGRDQLDRYRTALSPCRLFLVVLDPGDAVCRQRNATRPTSQQFFFDGYQQLSASMRRGFGDVGWWMNSSKITPEQTAHQILAVPSARALVTT